MRVCVCVFLNNQLINLSSEDYSTNACLQWTFNFITFRHYYAFRNISFDSYKSGTLRRYNCILIDSPLDWMKTATTSNSLEEVLKCWLYFWLFSYPAFNPSLLKVQQASGDDLPTYLTYVSSHQIIWNSGAV